jgi:hypothetical protein
VSESQLVAWIARLGTPVRYALPYAPQTATNLRTFVPTIENPKG